MLEEDGMEMAEHEDDADVVVLNTCCIRENAKTFLIENPEVMVQMAEKVREQAGVNAAGAEAPAFTEKDDEPIDLD